jgi:hypothetical protein
MKDQPGMAGVLLNVEVSLGSAPPYASKNALQNEVIEIVRLLFTNGGGHSSFYSTLTLIYLYFAKSLAQVYAV